MKFSENEQKSESDAGNLPDNILISVPIWRDKWVNAKHFNLLMDADVDMVGAVTGVENETFDTSRHMLATAAETKRADGRIIKVLVHSNAMTSDFLNDSEAEIKSALAEFKGQEALGGYHIIDEPYDVIPFVRIEKCIKEIDRSKIADINFLPGVAYGSYNEYAERIDDYLTQIGDHASFLSFDNYPFPDGEGAVSENDLFGNFEIIRNAGLKHNVPTAFYLQSVGGFNNSYRRPEEGTMRYHASAALAYGFKWIKYWSWFVPDYGDPDTTYKDYTDAVIGKDGEPSDLYEIAAKMNKEIHTVGTILAKLDAQSVYHTGSRSTCSVYKKLPCNFYIQPEGEEYAILSQFVHKKDGSTYLMIVNKDMVNAQDMTFRINGISSLEMLDKRIPGKLHNVKIENDRLSISLAAGDFVLYKMLL